MSVGSDASDAPLDPSGANAAGAVANGGDGNDAAAPSTIPEEVSSEPKMRSCSSSEWVVTDRQR